MSVTPATTAARTRARPGPRAAPRRKWSRYRNRTFYAFVAPWAVGFLALTLAPMLYALKLSFIGLLLRKAWGFGPGLMILGGALALDDRHH